MPKTLKIVAFTLTGLILFLLTSAFIVTHLIDPNTFKPQISQLIKQKTGRTLTIKGNIHWSFFPWAGLNVENVVLANQPNTKFKAPFFAKIGQATISVNLLPLLLKKVEMGNIKLTGLDLILIRDSAGKTNWDDLIPHKNKQNTQAKASPTDSSNDHVSLEISAISLTNANIEWRDQKTGQDIYFKKLSLQSAPVKADTPFTLTIKTLLENKQASFKAGVKFNSLVTLNYKKHNYKLINSHLNLAITQFENKKTNTKPLPINVSADIAIDGQAQTIVADNLVIHAANLEGQGRMKGVSLDSSPKFSGTINLSRFNPQETFDLLGHGLQLQNPESLQFAKGSFNFTMTNNRLALNALKFKIDKMAIDGNLSISDFTRPTTAFNLHIDELYPNNYATVTKKNTDHSHLRKTKKKVAATPTFLQQLTITKGDIRIDRLYLEKLSLQAFSTQVTGKQGIIQLAPITAKLYDGTVRGGATLNLRSPITTRYTINLNLNNVNLEKLLTATTGKAPVTGTLALNTNLTLRGSSKNTLVSTLNGKGGFSLINGHIKGLDAGQILSQAMAIVNKQPKPKNTDAQQTTFDKITGSFYIKNGKIHNHDLQLSSPTIVSSGSGWADLNNERLNYTLKITGVKSITSNNEKESRTLYDWFVPVHITGTFSSPTILPDFGGIAKQFLKKTLKKQITKQLDKNVGGAVEGILNKLLP